MICRGTGHILYKKPHSLPVSSADAAALPKLPSDKVAAYDEDKISCSN